MTDLCVLEIEKIMRNQPKIKAISILHEKDYVALEMNNGYCRDALIMNVPNSFDISEICV